MGEGGAIENPDQRRNIVDRNHELMEGDRDRRRAARQRQRQRQQASSSQAEEIEFEQPISRSVSLDPQSLGTDVIDEQPSMVKLVIQEHIQGRTVREISTKLRSVGTDWSLRDIGSVISDYEAQEKDRKIADLAQPFLSSMSVKAVARRIKVNTFALETALKRFPTDA